MGDLYTGGKLV